MTIGATCPRQVLRIVEPAEDLMGVAALLELDDLARPLLTDGCRSWSGWARKIGPLRVVASVEELRPWLRKADPEEADEVLWLLARLGSPAGGNSVSASAVLAWCLLPGACTLARQLQRRSPSIDELVAGRLWIEVRSFRWCQLRWVAANVLATTRSEVLRECSIRGRVLRADRAWSAAVVVDPQSPNWPRLLALSPAEVSTASEEVTKLLASARRAEVISSADQVLLRRLALAADRAGVSRSGRGTAGLMANEVSAVVAADLGVSPVTVRRRARRAIAALRAAVCDGRLAA